MEAMVSQFLWVPGWAAVGAAAHAADARWGVAFRGWVVNMCSPHPRITTSGFLKNRTASAMLMWSVALASAAAALAVAMGGSLVSAGLWVPPQALACWFGMLAAPVAAWAYARAGRALDRVDQAEVDLRAGVPGAQARAASFVTSTVAAVRARLGAVRAWNEARRAAQAAMPEPPTPEEVRQAKIDRMDQLLGRR